MKDLDLTPPPHKKHEFNQGLDPEFARACVSRVFRGGGGDAEISNYLKTVQDAIEPLLQSEEFFDTDEVTRLLVSREEQVSSVDIDTMREEGLILGLEYHGKQYFPAFQFDSEKNAPSDLMRTVYDKLSSDEYSDYHQLLWWISERDKLKGDSFAHCLHTSDGREAVLQELSRMSQPSDDEW